MNVRIISYALTDLLYFQASALFCGIDRPEYAYIIGSQTRTDSLLSERAKKEHCGFTSLDGVQNDGKKRGKITGIKTAAGEPTAEKLIVSS